MGHVSLRELARRAGVSHAAPTHHFRDKRGLLTALATEGLERLAGVLEDSSSGGFDEVAVAYVKYACAHPGHYAVMFRSDLLDVDNEEYRMALAAARQQLDDGVRSLSRGRVGHLSFEDARNAAWALVHGIASLVMIDAVPSAGVDAFTLRAARQLFS